MYIFASTAAITPEHIVPSCSESPWRCWADIEQILCSSETHVINVIYKDHHIYSLANFFKNISINKCSYFEVKTNKTDFKRMQIYIIIEGCWYVVSLPVLISVANEWDILCSRQLSKSSHLLTLSHRRCKLLNSPLHGRLQKPAEPFWPNCPWLLLR